MINEKKQSFKIVGLMGKSGSEQVKKTLSQIAKWLDEQGATLMIEVNTAAFMPDFNYQTNSIKMMGEVCDLVIVVGGDGCLLGAGRALAKQGTPILGVNRGRLGFLTDILPTELEWRLDQVFKGAYKIEHRFLLDAEIESKNTLIFNGDAVNDVVIHPGQAVQMIEFELYVEGSFVFRQRSDGLIIATPTGSTAYALSAGGPMMHPALEAISLVPICPHTLSNRPIVVPANSEIKIVFFETGGIMPHVSCDGQASVQVSPGDVLYVRRKPQRMSLVHPLGYDFYAACRSKLGWASKLT